MGANHQIRRPRQLTKMVRGIAAALLTGAIAATFLTSTTGPAAAASGNPVTPGNFTGFGFDQCQAPSQSKMDAWWTSSPFTGVGIYIAGASRGCRTQTYLNASWVRHQLARGWRLLPITLGPQASCNPRYPRYKTDVRINPSPTSNYIRARSQARGQGAATVAAAKSLGIARGSTLYYDLEAFDISNTNCRASALWFVSAFTIKVHSLGYKVGFYSSASSGIKAIYNTKKSGRQGFHFPDQLWIADWNGAAGTSTTYIPDSAWSPHSRVKQYQGGHDETYGRVTVNVDRDYLDVGRGSVAPTVTHCGGINVNWTSYATIRPASGSYRPPPNQVRALKCMLRARGSFNGVMTSTYGSALRTAIQRWQTGHHLPVSTSFDLRDWRTLWAANSHPVLKRGSAGESVRDLQRALNATGQPQKTRITGVLDWQTNVALVAYQKRVGRAQSGMVGAGTWSDLSHGK